MSLQWEPGDLKQFYRKQAALTHSQTLARRLLIAAILLVTLGVAVILKWWPK